MDNLIITPGALLDVIKEVIDGLLERQFWRKSNNYDKYDFKISDAGDELMTIQITKCSSGCPNLKFLLTNAMKKLKLHSIILKNCATVAEVETKSSSTVRLQEAVFSRNSSLSLIDVHQIKRTQCDTLKHYTAIMFLLKLKATDREEFTSLLLQYIMIVEQSYVDVKFVVRKEDKTKIKYIYWNKVKMDDVILSCNILGSSCAKIFRTSKNKTLKKELLDKFKIKQKKLFKNELKSLLHARANKNFTILNK